MTTRQALGDPAADDDTFDRGPDGKHACPYGQCDRRVRMLFFACRAHWMKVPAELRAELYAATAPAVPLRRYLEVRTECVEAMNAR